MVGKEQLGIGKQMTKEKVENEVQEELMAKVLK